MFWYRFEKFLINFKKVMACLNKKIAKNAKKSGKIKKMKKSKK